MNRWAEGCPRHDFSSDEMPTTLTRSAEQVILVASMIASRLLLGPCAAFQQVQVLLEVAIQHHYDIMPAQHLRAPLSKAAWPISRDQAQAPTAFGIAAFKMCSDAGRGSRRRDLHPKGDVCAGHKLASDIRWLYLLLAACAPVHAPLTRGHRLPPGTSGPSGSPGGARP